MGVGRKIGDRGAWKGPRERVRGKGACEQDSQMLQEHPEINPPGDESADCLHTAIKSADPFTNNKADTTLSLATDGKFEQ